jgi:predicted  nucleic acid-binding Zn-ribbon protein
MNTARINPLTNEELALSLASHIQNMLDLSDEMNNLVEKENQLQTDLENLNKRKTQLRSEIRDSKKLLEFCIENRSDPIQARLSNTDQQLKDLMNSKLDRELLMEDNSYDSIIKQKFKALKAF